jgi:hypothetical protein
MTINRGATKNRTSQLAAGRSNIQALSEGDLRIALFRASVRMEMKVLKLLM